MGFFSFAGGASSRRHACHSGPMIRHCVFVRFADDVTDVTRSQLFDDIAALAGRMPGLLAAHVGANVSPEHGMDKGY